VRTYVLTTRAQTYVESARVVGATPMRVICRHVLPNLIAPMLIYSSAVVSGALLAEGGLAFLGLGVRPPAPSWGRMLAEGRTQWHTPYLSIFPGAAITAAVLGFSLLGDSLRDELDPRLRHR
jgi:peptide/nickel transport system permease protein